MTVDMLDKVSQAISEVNASGINFKTRLCQLLWLTPAFQTQAVEKALMDGNEHGGASVYKNTSFYVRMVLELSDFVLKIYIFYSKCFNR